MPSYDSNLEASYLENLAWDNAHGGEAAMALVSSYWGAGGRILCHPLEADLVKKLDGHQPNTSETRVWSSDGSSCCSGAAPFPASAVALERSLRLAGCGRAWIPRFRVRYFSNLTPHIVYG